MGEFRISGKTSLPEALKEAREYLGMRHYHHKKWHKVIHNPDLIGRKINTESYNYSELEWTARIQVILKHDWQQLNG